MLFALLAGLAIAVIAAALASFVRRYRREREELQRVRDLFSRYVPEHVVDEILTRRDVRSLWAQRHHATIVCCRIRNFGFFSEELGAEDTLRHLNEFYAVAGRAIVRHGGVIERLHADGITAVFGVLTSEVFQEERALRAALRIIRLANAMNARWQGQGRRPFQVSIGVNSGEVVAGEVGFAQRREFAIVGNPALVASRLQQAAEDVNASILSAAATYEPVAEMFVAVPVTKLPLQGLRRLQKSYIIRGLAKRAEEELLHLPPEIVALQTVIDPVPAPAASSDAQEPFSAYDDFLPAMPEMPPVSGEYEEPTQSAAAPLPPLSRSREHENRAGSR
jgi:adenylate cyclase